jgi:hypothetical protein
MSAYRGWSKDDAANATRPLVFGSPALAARRNRDVAPRLPHGERILGSPRDSLRRYVILKR